MSRIILGTIFTLILAACGSEQTTTGGASAPAALPDYISILEWSIGSATGATVPAGFGQTHGLQSRFIGKWLVYDSRDYGINLGWNNTRARQVTFHRQSGTLAPIQYGERLAIHVSGGFVNRWRRDNGIDLTFSGQPSYEWIVKGSSGLVGSAAVGLYNVYQQDFLVYCSRDRGINLRWAKDCSR